MANTTNKFDERANIFEIQRYLRQIASIHPNIPLLNPDGIYGPETAAAVRAFQLDYGLDPTGIVDNETWDAIVAEYILITKFYDRPVPVDVFPPNTKEITPKYKGDAVYLIQLMLQSISNRYQNFPKVQINGIYDQRTTDAVKEFQRAAGLPITGNVDKNTWNRLAQAYRSYLFEEE